MFRLPTWGEKLPAGGEGSRALLVCVLSVVDDTKLVAKLAVGGSDSILQSFADRMDALHKAIASQAALPKTNDSQEEHILENFHSSRLIRKLILDSPGFAATLWKMALDGKCHVWAQGHR
ncbi:hypothetical protein GW17_00046108 [Ensete ventricosum]|nr:hypothetical protein GW17_00046108 [Ensete ventricosum]